MSTQKIIDALDSEEFPEAALAEAMERREEVEPALLDLVRTSALDPEQLDEKYSAVVCALYLLAAFRCREAAGPLRAFLVPADGDCPFLEDDFLVGDLDRILASISGGDLEAVAALVEDERAHRDVRAAALDSLTIAVFGGAVGRAEVREYCRLLLEGRLPSAAPDVWWALLRCCVALHLDELIEPIRQCYRQGRVDPEDFPFEEIEEAFAEPAEEWQEEEKLATSTLVDDPAADLWPRYDEWDGDPDDDGDGEDWNHEPPVPEHRGPKIGRNQPCPCGSGRKFKKCCGT